MRRDLVLAALAILALLVASFLTAKKPAAPKFATRASDDASFGGYLAWYELLAREGVSVTRFEQHHVGLDVDTDTLIAAFPALETAALWDDSENAAERAWIRGGGRLIDIGETPATQHEDLKGEAVLGVNTRGDNGPLSGPWAAQVKRLPARGTGRIEPQKGFHVTTLLRDRAGIIVARYALGRGDVIAISSASFFENRNLGTGDAARLAYLAGRPRHAGGVVAFDEAIRGNVSTKAWYRALNVPERVLLAFGALAGVLWLIFGLFRLGPPVRLRAPREPTSREFIDAVAGLYERAHAREHARDALAADAKRNLDRAAPTPEHRALAERAAAAAVRAVPDDITLVRLAVLARTAREETIRAGRHSAIVTRRTSARRFGAGDRRQ